jgi:molybdate transport system permease protein
VLPPAVAGIGLLAALGRDGLLGSSLERARVTLPFTQSAVTIAVAYVASPLLQSAGDRRRSRRTIPPTAAASRTSAAGPRAHLLPGGVPLARGGA